MTTLDLRVTSWIPSAHPHKAAIEARLARLVATLGSDWTLTIVAEGDGKLGVCLRQTAEGRAVPLWNSTLRPEHQPPAALEAWLRSLARVLQDELGLAIGFRVPGELSLDQRAQLQGAIDRHHGGLTRGGAVVIRKERRSAFLDETDELGIRLEISLWPRGRRAAYAIRAARRD